MGGCPVKKTTFYPQNSKIKLFVKSWDRKYLLAEDIPSLGVSAHKLYKSLKAFPRKSREASQQTVGGRV
jgi:hypothetical protein